MRSHCRKSVVSVGPPLNIPALRRSKYIFIKELGLNSHMYHGLWDIVANTRNSSSDDDDEEEEEEASGPSATGIALNRPSDIMLVWRFPLMRRMMVEILYDPTYTILPQPVGVLNIKSCKVSNFKRIPLAVEVHRTSSGWRSIILEFQRVRGTQYRPSQ